MTRRVDTQSFDLSLALTERLHRLIPGGTHTYAKGDDQYPADTLPILVRGQGCRVWDADGNEFVEYGMGLRTVALGHAFAADQDRQRVGGILIVAFGVGVGAAGNQAVQALGQRQRSVEAWFFPFVGH